MFKKIFLVLYLSLFLTCLDNAYSQPFAYVANFNGTLGNSISVIDTATNTVVGDPIPVGDNPIDVAVSPDGTTVYVSNFDSGNVSVIDASTNMVIATIAVGGGPVGVAVSPDGTTVYVVSNNTDSVFVIDTATNMVVGDSIPVGSTPENIVITPDGSTAYVTNFGSNNITVIDTATNTVVGDPIPVGTGSIDLAVSPDGTTVYVASGGSDSVFVIDTATNMVITTISVEDASNVAVSPDCTKVYVVSSDTTSVFVIDTATNTVVGDPFPVGDEPRNAAVSPDGTTVYVTNSGDSDVSVIDTITNMVITIPVVAGPIGIAIGPDDTITTAISTDSESFQLYSFYDLRDRESFVQVTNTDGATTVHVQIFDVSNLCNENNFFDTYTPSDTHIYNLRDILTNNGSPSGIALGDGAYGFVVVTAVLGSNQPANQAATLIGNFRIIDDSGYEYRTNSQALKEIFVANSEYTINFNTEGGVNSSDIVGITTRDILSGEVTVSDGVTFDVDILNNEEDIFSCSNGIFSCSANTFEYGINDSIPSSRDGSVLCPSNNISEGVVKITTDFHCNTQYFGGYVGLNNSNGRGSMDSLWENLLLR